MTDIIQEYWDIETLRQRVKDLEASTGSKRVIELQERVYLLEDKIAALKQQGEPVVWRIFNTAQSCWEYGDEDELAQMPYTLQPPEKLYTSAPTIPAGYVLVPVCPTPQMNNAAAKAKQQGYISDGCIYSAMIAAAPTPKEPK